MIVIGGSMNRLRARFRAQFTPVANGYVYRRGSRGEALPVSAADADAFVAGFDFTMRWLSWGGVAAAVLMFGTLALLDVHPSSEWMVVVPYVLVWSALFWVAWNAPHRILAGRAPVGRALTGREVRRNGLATLPWRVLVIGMLLAVGLAVRVGFESEPFASANLGYFAFAAALLLLFGGMALAKLRLR